MAISYLTQSIGRAVDMHQDTRVHACYTTEADNKSKLKMNYACNIQNVTPLAFEPCTCSLLNISLILLLLLLDGCESSALQYGSVTSCDGKHSMHYRL